LPLFALIGRDRRAGGGRAEVPIESGEGSPERASFLAVAGPDAVSLVLVEDHLALREGLELLLTREGCKVVGSVGDPQEAAEIIAESTPDVAIIDIRLPGESGIGLTRRLLRDRPDLGVVLYTGHSDVQLLYEGLDSGARGYALKDGPPEELLEAIRSIAAGGTYVDPRLRPALLSRGATRRVPHLSPREREILDLLAQGLTGERIATQLFLSPETVRTHVRNAMEKLEANTRVHAIAIALRQGEIALRDGSAS
jgi:DNA-binding NarL/FixJ family response regulator